MWPIRVGEFCIGCIALSFLSNTQPPMTILTGNKQRDHNHLRYQYFFSGCLEICCIVEDVGREITAVVIIVEFVDLKY